MQRVRLPRGSSRAYRHLKLQQGAVEEAQAHQQAAAEPQAPQEGSPAATPAAHNAQLVAALSQIKAMDVGAVLEGGTGVAAGDKLSDLLAAAQAGQVAPAKAVQRVRALCAAVISATWTAGNCDVAQAASTLLDDANEALEELEEGAGAAPAAPPPPPSPPAPEGPRLPAETFFLPADQVRDCLTLNIDSSILLASQPRRGGWPLGKRRNPNAGGAAPGKRKGRRQYNPWTPELQQQLATVLRLALSAPTAPGPRPEETAALPPALATLASHLRGSAAGEQLQAMGAMLGNVVSMLQVGGYTDFEELLSECREEGHAAVEAYLTTQSVDVRRGRLIAHAESFVHSLGSALEALLSQMRADHRAQVVAGLIEEEEEEERGDDFYPSALPPCILANKEPFRGGDWRKTPYIPRPYVRLSEYAIVEPEMEGVIKRKLSTRKHGGCDGQHCKSRAELGLYSVEKEGFLTHCSCLARNTECDERCACAADPGCLNRSVTRRETVQLGRDAEEVDSWGMDCYVRRNILDAVLESKAFGPWSPPDYQALQAADAAEYAAMRAATSAPGGSGASPAAAALAPPPLAAAHKVAAAAGQQQGDGPPSTPAGIKKEEGSAEHAAAVAVALASPPPTPAQIAVERRAADWMERELLPAINRQGATGWDLLAALQDVKARAKQAEATESLKAAEAVEQRVKEVGYNYFRLHPKGVGLVCKRAGGLPPLTFVEEYLGEIHTPWRWFEIQDAVKRITGDELPDFYNIVLERPKDDPGGYDVLFVDAAAKGALASRMSHSCTPNCQAIIMACGGRLTIALYTLRHVHEGEELTFDYSSVTESEKEFRDAICLCSTRNCRGSYLYFTGSRAFQQVMDTQHAFLHRQAIIARAGAEPLTDADWARIRRHGLGDSALGSVEAGDRAPDWLVKWTALICEFIEEEEAHLKQDLLAHPLGLYNETSATIEAKGVVANRLQNVVITLDKVKYVLAAPQQPQEPCLKMLSDEEAVEHLWSGPRSIARRVLRGCIQALAPAATAREFAATAEDDEWAAAVRDHGAGLTAELARMCALVLQPVGDSAFPQDARAKLMGLYRLVRQADMGCNGELTATADLLLLYASTQHWFTCERGYRSVTSSPVPLNLEDLTLDRAGGGDSQAADPSAGGSRPGSRPSSMADLGAPGGGSESEGQALAKDPSQLRKVYRPLYVWGQLSGWFKQTVADPTASLSAERRGTVSLPDIESSFAGGKARYTPKDRADLADQLEKRPDTMWRTGTIWSFRNDAKVYGSPVLDAAWAELDKAPGGSPLPAVVAELRGVEVPARMQIVSAGGSGKATRGGSKKKA